MRVVTAFALVLLLGMSTFALADPSTPPEAKEWHPDLNGPRTIIAETGVNDACPGPQLLEVTDVLDPGLIETSADDDWYRGQLPGGR